MDICGRGASFIYIHVTLQVKEKSGDLTCTWKADGYDDDTYVAICQDLAEREREHKRAQGNRTGEH